MNCLFKGGLTAACGIASGAVSYAARDNVGAVIICVFFVTLIMTLFTLATWEGK